MNIPEESRFSSSIRFQKNVQEGLLINRFTGGFALSMLEMILAAVLRQPRSGSPSKKKMFACTYPTKTGGIELLDLNSLMIFLRCIPASWRSWGSIFWDLKAFDTMKTK